MISLVADDSAITSASVDDRAMTDCSFDAQMIGQPAYLITYPVLDLAKYESSGSAAAASLSQSPAKFASTKQSKVSEFGVSYI